MYIVTFVDLHMVEQQVSTSVDVRGGRERCCRVCCCSFCVSMWHNLFWWSHAKEPLYALDGHLCSSSLFSCGVRRGLDRSPFFSPLT